MFFFLPSAQPFYSADAETTVSAMARRRRELGLLLDGYISSLCFPLLLLVANVYPIPTTSFELSWQQTSSPFQFSPTAHLSSQIIQESQFNQNCRDGATTEQKNFRSFALLWFGSNLALIRVSKFKLMEYIYCQ